MNGVTRRPPISTVAGFSPARRRLLLALLGVVVLAVVLAVAVLVSDAVANGWANHALDPAEGLTAGRVGHGVVTLVAVGLLVATPGLWRATSPAYRRSAELAASPNDRQASSRATSSSTCAGRRPPITSASVTCSSTRR